MWAEIFPPIYQIISVTENPFIRANSIIYEFCVSSLKTFFIVTGIWIYDLQHQKTPLYPLDHSSTWDNYKKTILN